jgi:pilus assembly protein Flp/PilA
MKRLSQLCQQFVQSEAGPTATEYAVMLAMIILACFGAVGTMGLTVASKLVIPGW